MYPGAQLSAVYGLMDLFLSANRIAMEHTPRTVEPLWVSRWQLEPSSGQVEVLDASTGPSQLRGGFIPTFLECRCTDLPVTVLLVCFMALL